MSARFLSVMIGFDRISPQFLANSLSGAFLGFIWAPLVCAAADIIGMIINSGGLVINPLITLSAALKGLIYAIVLYKKKPSLSRAIVAVAIVTFVVEIGMNSFWLAPIYGTTWQAVMLAKLPVRLITIPVYGSLLFAVWHGLERAHAIPRLNRR